jgi:hypothetical protein
MLGFLWTNTFLKIMVGLLLAVSVIAVNEQPSGTKACSKVSYVPNRSAVFDCMAGLSVVSLRNPYDIPIFTTVTASVRSEAWLTVPGDNETVKTIRAKLGAPVVLGPGAFMAVASGAGLVYVKAEKRFLLSVVWDVKTSR